jgi:hypothetical protein
MNENVDSVGGNGPQIEFRRLVKPLPDGRVRVSIDVRESVSRRLLGRIVQVRGGWRFEAVGGRGVGRLARQDERVWVTTEECKQALQKGRP